MSKYQVSSDNPLPLYYQVYSSLRERIESGEFQPDDPLPAERRLVDDYGVSRITIVKALDKLEADDLIERQHGRGTFVKQPPSSTTNSDAKVIGFLPGGVLNPYHYSVQLGIARTTTQHHHYLQVFGLDEASRNRSDDIMRFITDRVDGLVVYPLPDNRDMKLYQSLLSAKLPFVMVDRHYREIAADYVGYANHQAGYELTRFLLERGHERIAILPHYEVNASSIRERIAGYRQAMNEAGFNDLEDLIWVDVYANYHPTLSTQSNLDLTGALQKRLEATQPSALIGINHDVAQRLTFDLMVINAERARVAIAQNGSTDYELPVEIATFGISPPDDYGPYTVAVALHQGESIGERAAQLLIERLNDDFEGEPRHVEVPMEIRVRTT